MEANVRAFLVAEFSRIGQEQEAVRRKGEERGRALLDAWAGHVGTAAARSVKIAQEHSRVSPVTPLPRAMATDRVLRGTTITGEEDEEKRRTLPNVSGKPQRRPPAESGRAGVVVWTRILDQGPRRRPGEWISARGGQSRLLRPRRGPRVRHGQLCRPRGRGSRNP